MIKFNHIDIKNFMSIESTRLTFLPGNHIILGRNVNSDYALSNGSGKSSLVESVPYAIYRDNSRGSSVSRRGVGDTELSLSLHVNNVEMVINRYIGHKDFGETTKLFIGGEDVSARGVRRMEKDILSTVGMPFNLFVSSIMILQGFPVNFCSLTPTIRKGIIESMLGLVVWEEFEQRFSSAKVEESKNLSSNEDLYNERKLKMTSIYSKIEGLTKISEKYSEDLKENIKSVKLAIKDVLNSEKALDDEMLSLGVESSDVLNKESFEIASNLSKLRNRVSDLENSLSAKECSVCHQVFPTSMIESFSKEKEFLYKKIEKMAEKQSGLNDLLSRVKSVYDRRRELSYKRSPLDVQLNQLISQLQSCTDVAEVGTLKTELDAVTIEVNDLLGLVSESKRSVGSMDNILKTLQPSSKFRTKLVGRYISVLNDILSELSLMMFNDKVLSLIISENGRGIDIRVVDSKNQEIKYNTFSGGEKRRFDIVMVLALQKFLIEASAIDTNLICFDEIFDGLDKYGISRAISCIDSMFGNDKCVFVISHNEDIKSSFESSILVENIAGVSKVDYTNYKAM